MQEKKRPLEPVGPVSMDIVYFYPCPFCYHTVPVLSPFAPHLIECSFCSKRFPILPVDERSARFFKLMQADGKAAIDPEFL